MIINYCKKCGIRLSDRRGKHRPNYCRKHFSSSKNFIDKTSSTRFKKGQIPWIKGKVGLRNELNPAWKGDKVSYHALHHWINRNFGSPKLCSWCGENNPTKRYNWANINGKYLRKREDWIRLCVKCHCKMDNNYVCERRKQQLAVGIITGASKIGGK